MQALCVFADRVPIMLTIRHTLLLTLLPMQYTSSPAEILRTARKRAKMSQQEVADALGWGRRTYIRYENGQRDLTPQKASHVGGVLGIDPQLLLPDPSPKLESDYLTAKRFVGQMRWYGQVLAGKNTLLPKDRDLQRAFQSFLRKAEERKDSALTIRIAEQQRTKIHVTAEALGLSVQDTVLLALEVFYETTWMGKK